MEELFNTDPENKVRGRSKKVRSENDPPKVMNFHSAPRFTLGGGVVTEGNKLQVLTVPLPSQPGYLTARTAPPMVEKEVGRAPPRVKMAPIIVNVEVSLTGPPVH